MDGIAQDKRDIRRCTLRKGPVYAAAVGQDSGTWTTSSGGPTGLIYSTMTRSTYPIGWGCYTAAYLSSGTDIPIGSVIRVYFWARADASRSYPFGYTNDPATDTPVTPGSNSVTIGTTWAEYYSQYTVTKAIPANTTYSFRTPVPDTPAGNTFDLSDVRLVVMRPS